MSYIATVSRVAWASAPTIGDQYWAAQSPGWGWNGLPRGARWPRTTAGVPSRSPPGRRRPAPAGGCGRGWCGSGGGARRLERVQDVVDLDEVLAVAGQDVLRGQLVRLEAVEVALVQVEGRAETVDEPLGHRPADARRVGDPHRFGDPEALDVRGLAQQREVVGGEGEQAVDALLDLRFLRRRAAGTASRSRRPRSRPR